MTLYIFTLRCLTSSPAMSASGPGDPLESTLEGERTINAKLLVDRSNYLKLLCY